MDDKITCFWESWTVDVIFAPNCILLGSLLSDKQMIIRTSFSCFPCGVVLFLNHASVFYQREPLLLSFPQKSLIRKYYATNILTSVPIATKYIKTLMKLSVLLFDFVENKAHNLDMLNSTPISNEHTFIQRRWAWYHTIYREHTAIASSLTPGTMDYILSWMSFKKMGLLD